MKVKKGEAEQEQVYYESRVIYEEECPSEAPICPTEVEKLEKPKRSPWFTVAFISINLCLVAVMIWLSMRGMDEKITFVGLRVRWQYIILAIFVLYLSQFMDGIRVQILTWHANKRIDPILCIKAAALSRYYELITPFMAGGKPYQTYYFRSRGFRASHATSVPMSDLLAMKLGLAFFGIILFTAGNRFFAEISGDIFGISMVVVSFAINISMCLAIILASIDKRIPATVLRGIFHLLHKMKLIKNPEVRVAKIDKSLGEYCKAIRKLFKKPLTAGLTMLSIVVSRFLLAFMIYCICSAFVGFGTINFWFVLFASEVFEYLAGALPLPGGTGLVEPAFRILMVSTLVAGGTLTGGALVLALIIWKALSYMLPIVNGLGIAIYDSVRGNTKNKTYLAKVRDKAQVMSYDVQDI
jgi:uncharacterized protein (TIRG00374 family)